MAYIIAAIAYSVAYHAGVQSWALLAITALPVGIDMAGRAAGTLCEASASSRDLKSCEACVKMEPIA